MGRESIHSRVSEGWCGAEQPDREVTEASLGAGLWWLAGHLELGWPLVGGAVGGAGALDLNLLPQSPSPASH